MSDTPTPALTPFDMIDDTLVRIVLARITPVVEIQLDTNGTLTVSVHLHDTKNTKPDALVEFHAEGVKSSAHANITPLISTGFTSVLSLGNTR